MFRAIVDRYINNFSIIPCLGAKDIIIIHNPNDFPKCLIEDLPHNYKIQLTDYDTGDYCKIAFQFSHELGHVICGPNVNNWLIESACEFMSIDSMRYLAQLWSNKFVITDSLGNDFAKHFELYINSTVEKSFEIIGFTENNLQLDSLKKFLDNSPPTYSRDYNRVIAKRLFNKFHNNLSDLIRLFPQLSSLSFQGDYTVSDFWEHTHPDFLKMKTKFSDLDIKSTILEA